MLVAAQTHLVTFQNGLTLAAEQRPGPGFAFDLRLPLGSAHDPRGREGSASLLEEWLGKGAGTRDTRQFQEALDDLGLRRGGGVGAEATRFAVSGLNADLGAALSLYADLVQRPHLPDSEFAVLRDLARQDLDAMQDSPAEELALAARRLAFPPAETGTVAGYAHPPSGTPAGVQATAAADVRALYGHYSAAGAILSVVSAQSSEEVEALVRRSFGDWNTGRAALAKVPLGFRPGQTTHQDGDSQQAHLSLYWRGVDPTHPDWLNWHLSLGVLSGGSASRLFRAVREERGLAYSAQIGPQVLNDQGFMNGYAGSTPARAAETLEVMLSEVARLKRGVSEAEFLRARAALEASTVFGAESLRGRVVALTRDLSLFGRVRQPPELRAQILALTLEGVNRFLERWEPGPPNLVTLGMAR